MKKLIGGLFVLGVAVMVGVGMGYAADGEVLSEQKISDTDGGFTAVLDDYDSLGTTVASIGDLNGDGISDMVVGAPGDDDGNAAGNRGAVYILFMDADGTVDDTTGYAKISDTSGGFTATLDDNDGFGKAVVGIGDLNGDGISDIAVSAMGDDDGGTGRGAVYILFMDADGTVDDTTGYAKISDTVGEFTAVLDDSDSFGRSLAAIGDLDGDGNDDIAVGAIQDDDGGTDHGAVYILFMDADGTVDDTTGYAKISDTSGGFTATMDDYDYFGQSLAGIGDLDGDGVVDIAVGTGEDDDGGSGRGAIYILFLDADGTVDDTTGFAKISDTSGDFTATLDNNDYFGISVASIGDVDGDGVDDLLVGATKDDDGGADRGAVYVLFMDTDGTVDDTTGFLKISDSTGGFTDTLVDYSSFGNAVSSAGDLDSDGIIDVVVGISGDADGGAGRGALYTLFLDGTVPVVDTPSSPAPNLPEAFTLNIHGDSACTWDDSVYVALSGQNVSRVILSDNPQFIGARVLPYTIGNGSTILPSGEVVLPNSMYAQMTLPALSALDGILYGDYTLYAAPRGSSGNLGSIVSDTITLTPNTECNFPYEVVSEDNGSSGDDSGEVAPEEPALIPVENTDIISLSTISTDNTNEFYLVDSVNGALVKRSDPLATTRISNSWLNTGSTFVVVDQPTLDSLENGEPMLPKGPAILRFSPDGNHYYVNGSDGAPREMTTSGLETDLFGGTPFHSLTWNLPEIIEDQITKGRALVRFDLPVVVEWRNFVRSL